MTKREQIFGILKENISTFQMVNDADPIEITGFDRAADAILALPIEVPSIEKTNIAMTEWFEGQSKKFNNQYYSWMEGAKWMRNEILNRNK